ncbi:hypothetical protein NQ318_019560 [Aromia moschata]|uniref:C2H2-type domain-containing protein n=1 Tax=Aromia moschata TaxID=1265417 RepID=A0AAV8Z497_9CUCU|nr:hypothetical protein NQ318_019560 [Aromia moschata]
MSSPTMKPCRNTRARGEGTPILVTPKIEADDAPLAVTDMASKPKPVKCKVCGKEFTTHKGLHFHKRLHTGDMYKCKHCDRQYTRLNDLQRHEDSHKKRKVHVCRICGRTVKNIEHLRRHLVTHLAVKPFPCNTCNRGFSRMEHLQRHTPRCDGQFVFHCDICNLIFKHEESMSVHRKMHDGQEKSKLTVENLDNIDEYYYQTEQDDTLAFSNHSDVDDGIDSPFPDSSDMDSYLEPLVEVTECTNQGHKVVDVTATNKGRYFPPREDPVKQEECKEFPCPACRVIFPTVRQLATHAREKHEEFSVYKRRVMGNNRYKCSVCYKGFPTDMYLHVHMYYHNGCTMCEETFPNKALLTEHIKFHKKNLKKFLCTECGRGFVRNDYLVQHMQRHRGEKPFKCQYCGKGGRFLGA